MRAVAKFLGGMAFETQMRDHRVVLDSTALGGKDTGPSPKEVLLASILGCSGMDVAAWMKKHKVDAHFEMSAESDQTDTTPKVFRRIEVIFKFDSKPGGPAVLPEEILVQGVELSMTRYCGVSAMVCKTSPIYYTVIVNGEIRGQGQAMFDV